MKYETPELMFVGEAADVVQGVANAGNDILGQLDCP